MTNEQLTAYLQDDSYLYAISYEELKTLVMQYPYATNLRILLLKKSFLEQNKDYDRNLQMAATFTTNRKYLYQVVQKVKAFQSAPQSVILGEDYLELTELSNIEKLLAEKQVSDALGTQAQLDTLAADWQLEFGNLDTADDANPPKIKGRDAEEDEMFELAYTSQLADNQSIENDEDLNFLIDNIVSEFATSREGGTGPSVKIDFEADKSDFEIVNTALELPLDDDEVALDLAHLFREEPIDAAQKVVRFSDLFQEEMQSGTTEIAVNDVVNSEENKEEHKAEDDLLSHSFQSIKKEKDDLMAHSFAVLNGDVDDTADDNFMYSFIDDNELTNESPIKNELIANELINDNEIDVKSDLISNDLISNELISNELISDNEIDVKSDLISNELISDNELNVNYDLISNELISDNKIDVKSNLISNELINANEIDVKSDLIIDNELNVNYDLINNELISDNEIDVKSDLISDNELNVNYDLIDNELINANEVDVKTEFVDNESTPNDAVVNLDELEKQPFRIVRRETAKEIAAHSFPIVGKKAEIEAVEPTENKNFEQNTPHLATEQAPQYVGDFEAVTPVFDEKKDDTTEIMAAKKSDLELEILNENKVTIAAKPIVELPSEKLSFTEWLRQFRMNEAAAKGQTVAKTVEPKTLEFDTKTLEELDNQPFIETEDNRKTIKQNLDAIFETEEEVPEDLFGLLDGTREKTQKTTQKGADTEGYEKLIFQHLTTEIEDSEGVPSEKKKKKKKKEMHELAARSLEEDGEMVSETLADLLVWQGKTTKAMEMYLKLSLAFPDKSGYFAAKIETIKSNAA